MTTIPTPAAGMRDLGEYLRQQRLAANLSVRQLSAVTGISNPYLSQIERGLRRPSAEILQQLAQGLSLSAESLYVRAGLLDPDRAPHGVDARVAIRNDPRLDGPQRRALLDAYARIVGDGRHAVIDVPPHEAPADPFGAKQTYRHGNKEKDMNAKPDSQADRDMGKSPLKPFYAVLGVSDLAVEKLVELGQKAAKDAEHGVDDLQLRADELQHRANRDVAKALKGAKQLPHEAVSQAKGAVAKGRRQYSALARRGKELNLPGQAANGAQGLVNLAGRSRTEAEQAVGKSRHQASHLVEQGFQQASSVVEAGRQQAEHVMDQGRHEAERRLAEGRRVADRTRRAAAQQADKVVDQATHVVEAVTHAGRRPVPAARWVAAEARKPIARRRRSPGSAGTSGAVPTETRPVMTAGVDAGATTPTAKVPAAKKATAKKAATKKAAAKPAKRASSMPTTTGAAKTAAKTAAKRTSKRTAAAATSEPEMATPADMPPTPAAIPAIPADAMPDTMPDTPGDRLPTHSSE